jgi:DNA repair protein RecN (Recombination protein N)
VSRHSANLFDQHAGLGQQVAGVAALLPRVAGLRAALLRALRDSDSAARERERLQWQVEELVALGFEPAAWAELQQEHSRLAHVTQLLDGSAEALALMEEGEVSLDIQLSQIASASRSSAGL